ncbi:DUF3043 domain-containing protein [Actinokineospora bangkokensis]|uniref:DUF3043 domain-containing protein n=1 Tax=Actinokineospora bangkokensis TaxID=1193682 RepID=A0A1Q9LTC2_9PSEU|nr:DUF3043 domain-containing protein [Actinokineospora bangkokensis]OLR95263.1 hypothetical protein BJP25_07180 [Actinokineospora bangkokensis]
MRFLRRSADSPDTEQVEESAVTVEELARGRTAGKGRPTPKRREAEGRRRGPVAPPPKTTREAMRRARGSKEERAELAAKRKAQRVEQRQRMNEGDDRYLMPRDRGPVKAYVRDLVDSKRNLMGLFMPLAVLVFVSMLLPSLAAQQIAQLICMVMLLIMVVEGVLNGRRVAKATRAKFPKENIRGASVGWYAFMRAAQPRRLRVPKPRVGPGAVVA